MSHINSLENTPSSPSMSVRSVSFLVHGNEILLGRKVRGFGAGTVVGIGGKVDNERDRMSQRETQMTVVKRSAQREISEETGVQVEINNLTPMGLLRFYFPHIVDQSWNQEVHIFIVHKWAGKPRTTQDDQGNIEIEPQWFNISDIPFDLMWDDTRYWLSTILDGKKVKASFIYDENLKVIDSSFF